jgi:hypothetical protein
MNDSLAAVAGEQSFMEEGVLRDHIDLPGVSVTHDGTGRLRGVCYLVDYNRSVECRIES